MHSQKELVEEVLLERASNKTEVGVCLIREPADTELTKDRWRASADFAYATLDALAAHIAVLEASGKIIAVNQAWREFAAANSHAPYQLNEEANYLAACDHATGDDAEDAAAFAASIRAVIAGELKEYQFEYPCHSPTEERWFIGRVTRFQTAGPIRIVVTHENITARKRAERQLKESEEWLRSIFEASRDGIIVEDDERIIYVNQSYTTLLGYDQPDDLIGKHISTVLPPTDRERMLDYGKRRVRGGDTVPSVYEFKGMRKDGTLVELEASVSVSVISGKAFVTTAIRDIAERKQAEEALREARDELEKRVEERTRELAQVNEALKCEIVERNDAESARTELLRRLVAAQEDERRRIARELHDQMGQHLTAMMLGIKALKDSHRWESAANERFRQLQELGDEIAREVKTLAWELRPTVLDDLGLQTALANYIEKWTERTRVAVDFHCAGLEEQRLPPEIETTLYRIIQEALTNVLKHARATSVSLILELRSDHVFAIVEDDGEGFEVEAASSVKFRELRFGLLGMRERVALAGGTLNIESAPHVGTAIFVRIPLAVKKNKEVGKHDE